MSGIVGIVNFDGRPANALLTRRLTDRMQRWAVDKVDCAIEGNAGLGFAQLRTTDEAGAEQQPLSFGDRVYIVADARIDGRAALVVELRRHGRRVSGNAPDVELILHAYHAWGCDCVSRLLGDFVFAIWDSDRNRVFCARDHFGVKPLFFADLGETFIFANALDVVRMHPDVGEELNELAIADFLLFGFNQSLNSTVFKDVQRLAPAHTLMRTKHERAICKRYWSMPVEGVVRYRRQSEYVEHFKELFRIAVDDRLRGRRFAVAMSGGLDSTSVASMAHSLLADGSGPFDMRVYTNVYDQLIRDDERLFAGQVARALKVPIQIESIDGAMLHTGWDAPGIALPEPAEHFDSEPVSEARREFMSNCRVVLTGFGGDPLLASPSAFVMTRVLGGEWGALARGLWACLSVHGKMPSLGIRSFFMSKLSNAKPAYRLPAWLNRDFVTRLDLAARCEQVLSADGPRHPVRPEAYQGLGGTAWPQCFGIFDPGCSGESVEHRHPFFDVRLVRYVLAMPAHPWFERKALLREAMKGMLPDPVRLRPKTLLTGDPAHAVSAGFDRQCRDHLLSAPGLSSFIDRDAVPVHIWDQSALSAAEYSGNIRPFSLGYWLNYCWSQSPVTLARGAT